MQIDPCLFPCTKLKSKWIKELNINPVTLTLVDKKVERALECASTQDHFLNIQPVTQTLRSTIHKWDLLKLRSFSKTKDTVNKMNGSLQNGIRSPTSHLTVNWSTKTNKQTNKKLKKLGIKTPNTEESQMAERHLWNYSTFLAIKEIQIKTTLRYHLTPIKMAKQKH